MENLKMEQPKSRWSSTIRQHDDEDAPNQTGWGVQPDTTTDRQTDNVSHHHPRLPPALSDTQRACEQMSAVITEEDPMEERVRRVLQNAQRRDAMCLVYDGGTVPNAPRLAAFVSVDGESFLRGART